MSRLLSVLFLVAVGVVCLGFYLGWFQIDSDHAGGKANVRLTVDADKFREDEKTALAKVKGVERRIEDKVAGSGDKTMDGTVVSFSDGKLTMANNDGKEHSHTLAANVKVTCDGKTCTTRDLKAGMRIRVTTEHAEPHAASRIEALDVNPSFEKGA